MLNHNPKHQSEMVMSSQLKPFFADLGSRYQGKPICIYPASHLEHTKEGGDSCTLVGFTLDHHKKKDYLTIHTTKESAPQEITLIANLVWMIRHADGEIIAIEVNDEENKKLVLKFETCPD